MTPIRDRERRKRLLLRRHRPAGNDHSDSRAGFDISLAGRLDGACLVEEVSNDRHKLYIAADPSAPNR